MSTTNMAAALALALALVLCGSIAPAAAGAPPDWPAAVQFRGKTTTTISTFIAGS